MSKISNVFSEERCILIVEDDSYKAKELEAAVGVGHNVKMVGSVREAVVAIFHEEFKLVLLDMALPTFTPNDRSGGGTAQAQGGIEVLRALKARRSQMPVIIVSQYPDVEIEEDFIRLEDAAAVLSKRYRVRVIGAVGFNFQSRLWEKELRKVLAVA